MAPLRLVFDSGGGQFSKRMSDIYAPMVNAAASALSEASETALIRGRRAIASAPGMLGASRKWQASLHRKLYLDKPLHPAAEIYSKIPYSEEFEDDGTSGTISGKPLLWLPLDNAPMGNGGKRLTPKQFESQIGVLYKFTPKGRRPMLFAVIKETSARAKKPVSLSQLRRGRNPSGKGTVRYVPMYVGVESITDPKELHVVAAVQSVQKDMAALYIKYLEDQVNG